MIAVCIKLRDGNCRHIDPVVGCGSSRNYGGAAADVSLDSSFIHPGFGVDFININTADSGIGLLGDGFRCPAGTGDDINTPAGHFGIAVNICLDGIIGKLRQDLYNSHTDN